MLIRILSDNPGKSFTQNLDSKFVSQVKELFRSGGDPSVQQILRETLTHFETEKQDDDNLNGLRELWKKEKTKPQRPLPTDRVVSEPLLRFKHASVLTFDAAHGSAEQCPDWLPIRNDSPKSAVSSTAGKLLCHLPSSSWTACTTRALPTNRRSQDLRQTPPTSRTVHPSSGIHGQRAHQRVSRTLSKRHKKCAGLHT